MFEPKVVINSDISNEANIKMSIKDKKESAYSLISINQTYYWLEENLYTISFRLLAGFITNIVPLGDGGKKYFKKIANKTPWLTKELWNLYNQLEKMNNEGNLKVSSYFELFNLGYTGVSLGGTCPVDDVIKHMKV